MVPSAGSSSPRSSRSSVVFPLPFGPTSPTFIPAVRTKFSPLNKPAAHARRRTSQRHVLELHQPLRLALRGLKIDSRRAHRWSAQSIAASCPIIALAVSMRAFDFVVRAFGPRRSHSISVFTRLRRLSCCLLCDSR